MLSPAEGARRGGAVRRTKNGRTTPVARAPILDQCLFLRALLRVLVLLWLLRFLLLAIVSLGHDALLVTYAVVGYWTLT